MRENCLENFIRATRFINEEPIIAKLVVDGETVAAIGEIYPSLSNMIRNKISDRGAIQVLNVVAHFIPKHCLRQLPKLARAIVGNKVQQLFSHVGKKTESNDGLQLRRAISIQAQEKKLVGKHAIAPSAARLCYVAPFRTEGK